MALFVATWMADWACNQYHQKGWKFSLSEGVPLWNKWHWWMHVTLWPSKNQGWIRLSVDFYFTTECSCYPRSVFLSFSPSSLIVLLFASPCFCCQLVLAASSFEESSLSKFPILHFHLPPPLFPPLSHCRNKSLMTVVGGMQGRKDRDVITATYYSGCLFRLRHKKNKHDKV